MSSSDLKARVRAAGYPKLPYRNLDHLYAIVYPKKPRKVGLTWDNIDNKTKQELHEKMLEFHDDFEIRVQKWYREHPKLTDEMAENGYRRWSSDDEYE